MIPLWAFVLLSWEIPELKLERTFVIHVVSNQHKSCNELLIKFKSETLISSSDKRPCSILYYTKLNLFVYPISFRNVKNGACVHIFTWILCLYWNMFYQELCSKVLFYDAEIIYHDDEPEHDLCCNVCFCCGKYFAIINGLHILFKKRLHHSLSLIIYHLPWISIFKR